MSPRPCRVLGAALAFSTAGTLHANVLFAVWYLADTAASGSRGVTGVLLAVLVSACVWSIGALVLERVVKGGVVAGAGRRARLRMPRVRG